MSVYYLNQALSAVTDRNFINGCLQTLSNSVDCSKPSKIVRPGYIRDERGKKLGDEKSELIRRVIQRNLIKTCKLKSLY